MARSATLSKLIFAPRPAAPRQSNARSAWPIDSTHWSTMPASTMVWASKRVDPKSSLRRSVQHDQLEREAEEGGVMLTSAPETPEVTASERAGGALFPSGNFLPFFLVTALFFLWGIPNNLNDVLIRHFMKSFAITRFQAGLIQSAFYMGYFLLAMPAAFLMRRVGYKPGFVIGLLLFGAGAFLFWPAAIAGSYGFFLFALFVIASGLSFLETASNPFIAQLGDPHSSERRLNFAQAFNPLGAISGALIGTVFIFSGVELTPQEIAVQKAHHTYEAYLRSETLRVVEPYLVIGTIALIWAMLILRTKFPSIHSEHENESGDHGRLGDLFRYPHFLFAVVAQFFYVGAQVGTWSYFISYVQEYAHQSEKVAGYFLTGTLAAFGVGRFASAWLMRFSYQFLHVPYVPNHIRART